VKKRDESGHALVRAGNRALWRELPAMMVRRKIGEPGGPLTLIEINDDEPFDLWVGALMTDKASILDTLEGVYSIPAKMLRDEGRKAYEAEVEYSDQRVRRSLADATKTYRQLLELKPQGYPEQAAALHHYWTQVDQLVPMLNAYIAAEDGSGDANAKAKAWRSALWRVARDAFQAACPNETPRQKRAYALALRSLQGTQRKKDETSTPAMETQ
jgi:CRISPR system Cascade subunit CasA